MTGEFSDEDDLFKQDRERLKKAKRFGLCCTQKLSGRQKVSADK
jgi:hypothetical protein